MNYIGLNLKDMSYKNMRTDYETKNSNLLTKHNVFFAFNKEQLETGMKEHNIKDFKELVIIEAGGILPRINLKAYREEELTILKEYVNKLKSADETIKTEAILYELRNHECFYTGEISDVVDLFNNIFTIDEIKKVYHANYATEEI